MTLETIKTRLSSEGYTVFFVRQTLRITKGGQTSGDLEGVTIFQSICTVYLDNDEMVLSYGQANLPEEERFTSLVDLVQFLKNVFPL